MYKCISNPRPSNFSQHLAEASSKQDEALMSRSSVVALQTSRSQCMRACATKLITFYAIANHDRSLQGTGSSTAVHFRRIANQHQAMLVCEHRGRRPFRIFDIVSINIQKSKSMMFPHSSTSSWKASLWVWQNHGCMERF